MGVAIYAYGVDLDRLAAALGGRDQELREAIEPTIRPGPIERPPGEPTIADGLRVLIDGEPYDSATGRAVQLYALSYLCEHLGERLHGEGRIAFFEDLGWDTALCVYSPPLGLPQADDFPCVSCLEQEVVAAEYERFAAEDPDDEDDPDIAEAREELVGWLQRCVVKETALVTFQY